jgi:O-antigen ligase
LLAAGVAIFASSAPADSAPSTRPSAAWLAFAILAATGAVVAPYAYAAWLVLVEIVAFGAMAWLASGEPSALARALPVTVALLASLHGVTAVAQRLAGNPRPASTFLNPNHLAAWLAAAALFLAGTVASRDDRFLPRALQAAAGFVALAGIFVTGSRGAVLGFSAGAVALLAVTWRDVPKRARRPLLVGAAAIVLAVAAGVAVRFSSDDDPYRFHRTRIWAASLRGAAGRPILGFRPGQFAAAAPNLNFPLDNTPLRFERGFKTPHSDLLRAVCEFGFPAGLAALAAIALAAREVFRRRRELSGPERGAMAALVCLLSQGLVDDLTTRPALTMTGAAFAGLLLAKRRDRSVSPAMRVATVAAAGLVALALGVGEIAGYLAWDAAHVLPRGRLDPEQLERLRRSLAWNPLQPDDWQRLADHFVGDGRTLSLPDYAAAREATEHAVRLQPADAYYARAAARVEATACLSILPFQATRERAAHLYDEASRLATTDATIPLEASMFLFRAGDAAGSRRAAARALEVEPRAATPRLWLASAILRQDGPAGAKEAARLLDEALELQPHQGEVPTSSYDAALRSVEPKLVESIRRELDRGNAASRAP